jgi:FlaA1/EpsC-like NDP-sugar epimerase
MDKFSVFFQKLRVKLPFIIFDIGAVPVSWFLAYWVKYNLHASVLQRITPSVIAALFCLVLIQTVSYYTFKVYRGLWRFSSLSDLTRILQATLTATLMAVPAFYLCGLLNDIPRAIFPLYSLILTGVLCTGRLIARYYSDLKQRSSHREEPKRVLIVGAGLAGEGLVRDLKRSHAYIPVGFVDDQKNKRGLEVHGVRVLGTIPQLPELAIQSEAELIFIAIPSAGSAEMRRIVNFCELCNVPFRTLPSLQALASGHVEVNDLRKVNIEDLLGRDQVQLSWEKISSFIEGYAVLVTGAGGSIGAELCRQIARLKPQKLCLLDNNEYNLYNIEQELKQAFPHIALEVSLTSVVDSVAIGDVFRQVKPEIVFHAAAYKHVPMLENQVRVAVRNNIIGTQIVAEASVHVNAKKFILISTDKAVNPTNVMGTTKRVAEIYCQNLNSRVDTQFITVRFGNVLGSVGSVVPLFQKQLERGGPLTVTHPDIQRYFMTIPEASQLILQAMVNGNGGEIFVLDMGEPIKINYLAEQMIRLAGKVPGKDIQIQYTGLRPGEKLFEELFHPSEQLVQTEHEKLFKAKFREIDWNELTQTLRMINSACSTHQHTELLILLKSLVPEFRCELLAEV